MNRFYANEGNNRVLVVKRGKVYGFIASWTTSCSGCYEMGQDAPYDDKAHCFLGMGCDECGYTGKRRQSYWFPLSSKDEQKRIALRESVTR
jgi:hypothetical protein